MSKTYEITTDYDPYDYDVAKVIACGATVVEALRATEKNALLMLTSEVAKGVIPTYDEFRSGKDKASGFLDRMNKLENWFGEAIEPDDPRVVDGIVVSTVLMLAELVFMLKFAPSKKLYAQLVVAETFGEDLLLKWTYQSPAYTELHQEIVDWYRENRATAGSCQELIEDAGEGPKDLSVAVRILGDRLGRSLGESSSGW